MYGLAGTIVDRVYTGEFAVRFVAQDARVEMLASIAVSISEDQLNFTDRGRRFSVEWPSFLNDLSIDDELNVKSYKLTFLSQKTDTGFAIVQLPKCKFVTNGFVLIKPTHFVLYARHLCLWIYIFFCRHVVLYLHQSLLSSIIWGQKGVASH